MNASGHATYNSRRQSRSSNKSSKSSYFCSGSSPPELHALPNTDESGVEAIFRHFSQGMAFWECLKTCRPCLEAHSYRVLDMVENVIGFLSNNVTATAANSVGGAEKHSRSRSGTSGSGIRSAPQTFVQPCVAVVTPTSPSLAAALENLPPMVLGWFTLDDQQGATLIRFIYRRMLRQIASVLDEMQQMEHDQHIAWERELATYLMTVLQILEGFER
ncbi:hypothetical protein ASPNIDRAFT_55178 [Aspergillus niger ATCC 1015]|uniref:Uncharacterized protein n=1 Tax=Aspergillus niger (strain ATCC 1015 / CBS 113.46 / FGSC A1144 / LSHB Ac4 / NCTC 3858a / NRRL 328 / USDA 3528.7) TaxID=380704 RepID=G3XWV2_ASPNA|nr:hypothetical protein ASPNIDRAFT_55178 [Aspergillus niger ATCC 1015]GKZ90172.1 hypothetical protein AnigIFM59636_001673 [Aspergillus niger]